MRNRLIVLAAALVILVVGSVAVIFFVNRSPKLQNVVYKIANTNTPTTNANANQSANRGATLSDQEAIRFVTRNFTETYGSYSNQNGASNILEAIRYATAEYSPTLRQEAVVQQAKPASPTYQQVITKALAFKTLTKTATSATLVVSTQQRVTNGNATAVNTKDILIDVKNQKGVWLVDAAVWK